VKLNRLFTFFIFILLFAALIPGNGSAGYDMNEDVITSSLVKKLNSAEPDEIFNLIVQFEDSITDQDISVLEALGFELVEKFRVIPAVHVFGNTEGIVSLSRYDRTYWIETNDKISYNLDLSTSVINATKTWNRFVNDYGDVREPIDGTGVTVVVADTGIDATHPDLDYHEKVIMNLKKDLDHPGGWKEMENTDTFFGHGTHCAGIVGGTGEASAQARRGVAPGVSLIGLSIGDPWETNEVGGLEWVYEHSKPNANPYNIRVVTNSWGYEDFDESFKDAVMEVTRRITYDNNVVVVFAASNDGGDGEVSTTNIYGNVPGAISVAASQRDGSGLASFSSRGDKTKNETWPDIMAPGVDIWAPRDSAGLMGIGERENPYYITASGTSMATPHIAGVVALLFQAAPSLKISDEHDDYSIEDDAHWSDPETRIHEVEYILKATADYIPPSGDNGVPDNFSIGLEEKPHDFAQGYGLVNVERAVGMALALEELRKSNPEATVNHALQTYMNVINDTTSSSETDILAASWNGEYTLYNDQNDMVQYVTSQVHYVHIANQSKKLMLDLSFPPVNLDTNTVGTVTLTIDYDDDGNVDWSGSLFDSDVLNGQRHYEIEISQGEFASHLGKMWGFSIYGYAYKTQISIGQQPLPIKTFKAPTIEYQTSVQQQLDFTTSEHIFIDYVDFRSSVAQLRFGDPSMDYTEGRMELHTYEYNLSRAVFIEDDRPRIDREDSWLLAIVMNIVLGIIVIIALIRRLVKERKVDAKIMMK
jgi:serine protease AprX